MLKKNKKKKTQLDQEAFSAKFQMFGQFWKRESGHELLNNHLMHYKLFKDIQQSKLIVMFSHTVY